MVLRKLSQSFKISLALMLSVLSSGLLQVAPAYALAGAVDDSYTVDENSTSNSFTVTSNDTGSNKLEVTAVSDPANGTALIHANKKSITYTPDTDYAGSDTFTYTLTDKDDNTTSVATVSVTVEEDVVVDQTCDDVVTPGSNGWTTKFNEGYPDTYAYVAPTGYLVDQYCVKAGSSQQGNGPIIVPVSPASASVTIDYPNKDSISHFVVHLIPDTTRQIEVSPNAPTVTDLCGANGDTVVAPEDSAQITYTVNGNIVTATLVNPTTHDFGAVLNGYVIAGDGLTATYTATLTDVPCDTESVTLCHATGSETHPFEKITVNAAGAFNGHLGNSHQDGRDIIPTFTYQGQTYSQNWNAAGMAIYNNGCVTPTDVCPLVPGVQTDTALCPPGQGGGQTLGDTTTKTPTTPQVLGTTTELPAALPSTGGEQNPMLILLASLMAYGIAYLFQGRRQLTQIRA